MNFKKVFKYFIDLVPFICFFLLYYYSPVLRPFIFGVVLIFMGVQSVLIGIMSRLNNDCIESLKSWEELCTKINGQRTMFLNELEHFKKENTQLINLVMRKK